MSYSSEIFVNAQVKRAALSLETINASRAHRLDTDAKKLSLLAKVIKFHSENLKRISMQDALKNAISPTEFYNKIVLQIELNRHEAAYHAKSRREKREQAEAERQAFLEELATA